MQAIVFYAGYNSISRRARARTPCISCPLIFFVLNVDPLLFPYYSFPRAYLMHCVGIIMTHIINRNNGFRNEKGHVEILKSLISFVTRLVKIILRWSLLPTTYENSTRISYSRQNFMYSNASQSIRPRYLVVQIKLEEELREFLL